MFRTIFIILGPLLNSEALGTAPLFTVCVFTGVTSQLFDDLGHESHIFSECTSPRLTTLTTLTTLPPYHLTTNVSNNQISMRKGQMFHVLLMVSARGADPTPPHRIVSLTPPTPLAENYFSKKPLAEIGVPTPPP